MRRMNARSDAHDSAPDAEHRRRVQAARSRVGRLAGLLDGLFQIPGTRIRVGLDSIIGLIPGIGDVAGVLLGSSILVESLRVGAPRSLLVRMLGNLAVDALGGMLPVVGDLFDVAFRSHAKNARLLLDHLDAQAGVAPKPRNRWLAVAVLLGLLLLLCLVCLGLYTLIRQLL
jgi:hypothetical protein